ncbi:MAG: hypothetical protein QM669_00140 [Siphonobacter sp.]
MIASSVILSTFLTMFPTFSLRNNESTKINLGNKIELNEKSAESCCSVAVLSIDCPDGGSITYISQACAQGSTVAEACAHAGDTAWNNITYESICP